MQHAPINDSTYHRFHEFNVRDRVEGNYDTLPIISTFPKASPLSVLAIRSKAGCSTFLGRRIARVDCISF
jgi:hypothetical protein